ncbi:MAG: hypothetical protein KDD32_07780 [Bacteroidetes bacterium]|nr:hypothetical protein [Bacteroidota bacterium]
MNQSLFPHLLFALILLTICFSCEDEQINQEDTSLSAQLCRIIELDHFCEMLQISNNLKIPHHPDKNRRSNCDSIQTLFAFTNATLDSFLLEFPHWNSIQDIPDDSIRLIIDHHTLKYERLIYDTTVVTEPCDFDFLTPRDSAFQMGYGVWAFLSNSGEVIAASSNSGRMTTSPLMAPVVLNEEGAVYIIDRVLGPF